MNEATNKYIDIALSKLKICKQYGTNYFGNPLPKGCVYGRATKNVYVYVDNLWQFNPKYNVTRFIIWVLDARKDSRFKEIVVSKHTDWYNMIFAFIDYNNLFDAKVEPLLCRITGQPVRKQPQTYDGHMYNVPYRHRKILEWEDTYCTETDAVSSPITRLDPKRVDEVKKKRAKHEKLAKEHMRKYEQLLAEKNTEKKDRKK